jgi:hypothetical protein
MSSAAALTCRSRSSALMRSFPFCLRLGFFGLSRESHAALRTSAIRAPSGGVTFSFACFWSAFSQVM